MRDVGGCEWVSRDPELPIGPKRLLHSPATGSEGASVARLRVSYPWKPSFLVGNRKQCSTCFREPRRELKERIWDFLSLLNC